MLENPCSIIEKVKVMIILIYFSSEYQENLLKAYA